MAELTAAFVLGLVLGGLLVLAWMMPDPIYIEDQNEHGVRPL